MHEEKDDLLLRRSRKAEGRKSKRDRTYFISVYEKIRKKANTELVRVLWKRGLVVL